MIGHERWLNREVEQDTDLQEMIKNRIDEFLKPVIGDGRYTSAISEMTLFTLNPQGGRVGHYVSERDRLERLGIEAMREFGIDLSAERVDEREKGLDENGARADGKGAIQYLAFSSSKFPQIEFRREAKYVMIGDVVTSDVNKMEVNKVKWSVRYAEDSSYNDVAP